MSECGAWNNNSRKNDVAIAMSMNEVINPKSSLFREDLGG
jgi:hypothetical protein